MTKIVGKMCTGYIMAVGKVSPRSGLLRGQNQPVDQVTAAALLKYGRKCTLSMCDFEK